MKGLAAHSHSSLKILNQELIFRAQREIVPPDSSCWQRFKAPEAAGTHSATWLLLGAGARHGERAEEAQNVTIKMRNRGTESWKQLEENCNEVTRSQRSAAALCTQWPSTLREALCASGLVTLNKYCNNVGDTALQRTVRHSGGTLVF